VRSILYRFPDLAVLEQLMRHAEDEADFEFGVPPGESVEEGEWILCVFELGTAGRATSAAGRAVASPEGAKLLFEPRDWKRLMAFAHHEATGASALSSEPAPAPTTRGSQPDTARSTAARLGRRASGTGSRVLLVDDDPDIREMVAAMLEAVDLVVQAVPSAEEALEQMRTDSFDLLVLDWNLPKMNGIDLCRAIRSEPRLSTLPVLFLTANASSQDMVEAFACGGDDYVVKPFRAPELGARIFSLLRRTRRLRA